MIAGLLATAIATFGILGTAGAGAQGSPSDDRATFEPGNPNTCDEAGTPASNVLSVDPPVDASDGNVSGDIADYEGQDPPGATPFADNATMLNVTVLNPNVVIRGVIVKGGPNANVYPTNVQNMISPFNNGGNVPAISHWLVCYDFGGPPPPPDGNGGNGGNGDGAGAGAGQPGAAVAVVGQARFTG
jgi:hypothetical protein